MRRRISKRVRWAFGPSVRNAFSQMTPRRILTRVFGLVFRSCLSYWMSVILNVWWHHIEVPSIVGWACTPIAAFAGETRDLAAATLVLARIHLGWERAEREAATRHYGVSLLQSYLLKDNMTYIWLIQTHDFKIIPPSWLTGVQQLLQKTQSDEEQQGFWPWIFKTF